ncbi:MAG: bifunctional metallophosphatase/5'-nucleotidase, partial [Hyphomicrobiales bacterium]
MGRFMRRLAALALLLLAAASPAVSAERKVSATLFVFSDIYEMSEQNGRGGFARVAGVLAAERAKSGNTLVTFAGDTL